MSIKAIAEKAGLSTTAVSQILNKKTQYSYSKESVEKVNTIAQQMNYQPNYLARSLRSGKRFCIGMAASWGLKNVGDAGIIRTYNGLGAVLDDKDYYLTFLPLGPADLTDNLMRIAKGRMVDGFITMVYSSQYHIFLEQTLPLLIKENMPFVAIHFTNREIPCHNVGLDVGKAGYLAAQHLVSQGYKKVGLVALENKLGGRDLYQGYCQALDEAGLDTSEFWLSMYDEMGFRGYDYGKELVQKGNLPDAFVVYSDSIASGMIKAFEEAGIKVPDDIGIVGCADLFEERYWASTITSIDRKQEERGRKAAEFLFDAIENKDGNQEEYKTFIAEPELIVRQSSIKT